tara:strand:- start:858 stop:986 length:129 start_codon:yes stop_codon:yes gene_type:complete
MIKKILIIFFLLTLVVGCGKKSDPIFKDKNKKSEGTKLKVLL